MSTKQNKSNINKNILIYHVLFILLLLSTKSLRPLYQKTTLFPVSDFDKIG